MALQNVARVGRLQPCAAAARRRGRSCLWAGPDFEFPDLDLSGDGAADDEVTVEHQGVDEVVRLDLMDGGVRVLAK